MADLTTTSSSAVEALHKAMVTLRNEVENKNRHIQRLEEKLSIKKEKPAFEDIFMLQVDAPHDNMSNGKLSTEIDFDEILLYEDAIKAQETRLREEKEREASEAEPFEDPIMEFVLSEEEENEEPPATKGHDSNDFRSGIELVPNEDIEVHRPPSNLIRDGLLDVSGIRPILKGPCKSPRLDSGSQTDISALGSRYWSSEPHLSEDKNDSPPTRPLSVTFNLPVRNKERRPSSRIINRPISAKTILTEEITLKNTTTHLLVNKSSTFNDETSHKINDVDQLLQETSAYLAVAKKKLVTFKDWQLIQRHVRTSITRRKNGFQHSSKIPCRLSDLTEGALVRVISPKDRQLMTGTVIHLSPKADGAEVKLSDTGQVVECSLDHVIMTNA